MRLRVRWFSGVGQTIQKVGRCNRAPCLIKQLFPKSFHPALGVLAVPNTVTVDLDEFNVRYGWILEIRIDQQDGTEVGPLLAQPLMSLILISAGFHGFLRSIGVAQESSSVDGREICHKPCDL